MKNGLRILAFVATALVGAQAFAAAVGDELPAFTLNDEAGTAHTLDDSIQRIYAQADRKGDGLLKGAMTGLKQADLDAQKAIVVADISQAPGFVKRIIRSSLKDRSYTTWLDVSGSTRNVLPYAADQVTVIELARRKITAIRRIGDAAVLKQELSPALAKPAQK